MFYNPTRTIRFNVQVYDVYTGKQLIAKNYQGDAEWTLANQNFTLRSDKFGTSDYGQRVAQLAKYAIADIVSKLRCQFPTARVVQINDTTIRINLGANANIKKGMKFNLIHRSDYQDRHNMTYFQNNETDGVYEVINVSPTASTLKAVDINHQLINVMLDDIVTLQQ